MTVFFCGYLFFFTNYTNKANIIPNKYIAILILLCFMQKKEILNVIIIKIHSFLEYYHFSLQTILLL